MADEGQVDRELQQFMMIEQQKAQFQQSIHRLNDVCWDKCVDRARDKLDSRQESCLSNCVERFFDTSLLITQRFQKLLSGGNM